jgi:hypothetical protein
MDQIAVKIGLDSFIEERKRSQQRPPLRVVPVVVSNNCSTIPGVVNMLENISAQALNRHSDEFQTPCLTSAFSFHGPARPV